MAQRSLMHAYGLPWGSLPPFHHGLRLRPSHHPSHIPRTVTTSRPSCGAVLSDGYWSERPLAGSGTSLESQCRPRFYALISSRTPASPRSSSPTVWSSTPSTSRVGHPVVGSYGATKDGNVRESWAAVPSGSSFSRRIPPVDAFAH